MVNWCKEGNPKADAYSTALDSLQCVPLLLFGVGESKEAIFENGSDVGRVYFLRVIKTVASHIGNFVTWLALFRVSESLFSVFEHWCDPFCPKPTCY